MIAAINSNYPGAVVATEDLPRNWAVAGKTVAQIKSSIDTYIAQHNYNANFDRNVLLVNLGVNEQSALPDEATWKSNYSYIINALITEYPNAEIYLTDPWQNGYDAAADTEAGWITDLIGTFAISNPGRVFQGDDERVWFKPNVATYSDDGVHRNATGQAAEAVIKLAVLGY